MVSVYLRRPSAGQRSLFFVLPKKSNQKKGARRTHDFPVPRPPEWIAQKCPRQPRTRSGSSNGSDTSHSPTKRYTAR
ncbi:ion transporter [Burkholderia metallica]|nr:ion transporter [Burkholderia metallica]